MSTKCRPDQKLQAAGQSHLLLHDVLQVMNQYVGTSHRLRFHDVLHDRFHHATLQVQLHPSPSHSYSYATTSVPHLVHLLRRRSRANSKKKKRVQHYYEKRLLQRAGATEEDHETDANQTTAEVRRGNKRGRDPEEDEDSESSPRIE